MSKTVRISGPRKWTYNDLIFRQGTQIFLFWDHFLCWMAWTALTWLGVAQFSQGGATGHTKFQVFAYFLPFRGPQGPKIDENVH